MACSRGAVQGAPQKLPVDRQEKQTNTAFIQRLPLAPRVLLHIQEREELVGTQSCLWEVLLFSSHGDQDSIGRQGLADEGKEGNWALVHQMMALAVGM